LAEDTWDSIAAFPEAIPLTDMRRKELHRRLQTYAQNPKEGISWNELKEKMCKPT
jgi:putative addiction module component (TIGR02574 family)